MKPFRAPHFHVSPHHMRGCISLHSFLFVVALPTYCFGGDTLCHPKESAYFSCMAKGTGKVISLCGNSLNDREHFWLQYRFGTPNNIEFAYPQRKKLFSESGFEVIRRRTAVSFDMEVSFNNGGWSYTVFIWPGNESYWSGVHVARSRNDLSMEPLKCSGGLQNNSFDAFYELVSMYQNTNQ